MPSRFCLPRDSNRASLLLVLLLLLLPDARAASGQAVTMTAALESSLIYKPGAWHSVRLQFRNNTADRIDGYAVLPLADPRAPAIMRLPVSVPPHARLTARIWAYFGGGGQGGEQRKSAQAPPLAVAEWRGEGGSLLARAEIVGIPFTMRSGSDGGGGGEEGERGDLFLLVNQRSENESLAYDTEALIRQLAESTGISMALARVDADALPRHATGLRTIKALVLEGLEPEALDLAQQEAIRSYVQGGGIVLVAAPIEASNRPDHWIHTLLPVRLIGTRVARDIEVSPNGPSLRLREPLKIVEAVEGSGRATLRSRDYVHAAVQPVGLGKVVFCSFPLNALAEDQPQATALWAQLLSVRQPTWEWRDTQLGEVRHQVLASMIGRKVAPWSVAAGIVGGYVLLVLLTQFLFTGPARPKAFAMSIAIVLVVSVALVAMGMMRRGKPALQEARLAVLDIDSGGNGWRQESLAFVGEDDPAMRLIPTGRDAMIRPAMADGDNPALIRQQPFAAEQAGSFVERIERVWEASGPADPQTRIRATARFGPTGLSLDVDNGLGQTLEAPLIVWNRRALATADLSNGASAIDQFQANDPGDFGGLGVVSSDLRKRRALVVAASFQPANRLEMLTVTQPPPMLIGWLSGDVGEPLVRPAERDTAETKSMLMVRTPLQIEPPSPGTTVSVPAALVSIDFARMPYDVATDETVPTPQDGRWLVGFEVPPAIGRVRPTRATLRLRVTLPGHQLTVRKGQCSGGVPRENEFLDPVGAWDRTVGPREVSMDLEAADVDRHGRLWLLIDVHSVGAPTGANPLSWQIADVSVSMDAEVVGPPAPIALGPATKPAASRVGDEEVN